MLSFKREEDDEWILHRELDDLLWDCEFSGVVTRENAIMSISRHDYYLETTSEISLDSSTWSNHHSVVLLTTAKLLFPQRYSLVVVKFTLRKQIECLSFLEVALNIETITFVESTPAVAEQHLTLDFGSDFAKPVTCDTRRLQPHTALSSAGSKVAFDVLPTLLS